MTLGDEPPAGEPRIPGLGRLTIERAGGRSVVSRAFAASPLRLLTPRNHGRAVWVYTSTYGGGLVDGDRIAMQVDVRSGAAAFVSSQASTKIYRSTGVTRSELHATIGPGGLLIAAPDPVVPFAGSRYRQAQRFQLEEDGALVAVDCLLSGRRAFGERWAFTEYTSLIEVVAQGRLLVYDALALRAADGDLRARLGRFDALAVVVLAGRPLRQHARELLDAAASTPLARRGDLLMAASPLGEDGCLVRCAGTCPQRLAASLRAMLSFVPGLLADDPWRRKW